MRIAVYCGANLGTDPEYQEAAKSLGCWIAKNGYELVYGGEKLGLMGVLADSVLDNGGKATGVIPKFLHNFEHAYPGLTKMITVDDLAQRKRVMMDHADVCIALPGGIGTLEEIIEAFSWARVGQNNRPCIFFNANQYYHLLEAFFDQMVEQKFLSEEDRQLVLFIQSLPEVDSFIKSYYEKQGEGNNQ